MRTGRPSYSSCAGPNGHRHVCLVVALLLLGRSDLAASNMPKVDPREILDELRRLGARKSFLTDSPDVYLEPKSLNRFFNESIYRRLQGNAYFGYDYDEGFQLVGNAVQIEVVKDLTPNACCQTAFRLALAQGLQAQGLAVKPSAPLQIGVCIVGVEPQETPRTLPGLMVEAYLRNSVQKKSFFIRYGTGHPRGLAPAIRLSAEMLAVQLVAKRPELNIHDTQRQHSR